MVIFDEAMKAKLDREGGAIVIDGNYLVMSQKSFDKVVESVVDVSFNAAEESLPRLLDILSEARENSGQEEEKEANGGFIEQGCKCYFCGKKSDATEYKLEITGGYFSPHDTEVVSLEVCAACLEKMLAAVS